MLAHGVTVSFTLVFLVSVPEEPVMVMVDFPVAAPAPTVNVKVLVDVVGFGLNVAVTPLGAPVALSVTA